MAGFGGYVDPFRRQSVQSPLIPKGVIINAGATGGYSSGETYPSQQSSPQEIAKIIEKINKTPSLPQSSIQAKFNKLLTDSQKKYLLNNLANNKKVSVREIIRNLPQYVESITYKDIQRQARASLNETGIRKYQRPLGFGLALSSEKVAKPVAEFVKSTARGSILIPYSILSLIKNPREIKNIPRNTLDNIKDTIKLIRTSPSEGIARVAGTILTFVMAGKVLKLTGKVSSKVASKINSKLYKTARIGEDIPIRLPDGTIKLKVVGKIPTESFAKQVSRAGTRVNAISSQADNLVNLIRREKIVMKPIPITEKAMKKLSSDEKYLMRNYVKKLDLGEIKANELIKLDKLVKKAGSKGILERSFFADPNLRIRPSRLGIKGVEKEANLRELLSGKATLKKSKPQILLFEDVKIQNFPKSLRKIKSKLKRGVSLTESEGKRFLSWQQKKSGRFKPVGFVTRESEITLAPGEILKRSKKVGTILVKGKKVPIISTKVIKPSNSLKSLLKKASSGKIKPKELKTLSKKLSKETKFKYSPSQLKKVLSSSYKVTKKYYPLKRKLGSVGLSSLSRGASKRISKSSYPVSKKVFYTSKGTPYVKTSSGNRFISTKFVSPKGTLKGYSPNKALPKSPSKYAKAVSKPYYPTPKLRYHQKGQARKVSFAKSQLKRKSKSSSVQVFNVYGKSGKRFVKLNNKPLRKIDALSKGTYAIDNTTSKSFKIVPAGKRKKFGGLRKGEDNYFNRAGYKLREYRVKRGRAFMIKPRYIEKTKYGIDTRGEKSGLSIAKFLKQQRRGTKHTGKYIARHRKISPSQRKVMLKNLKKARGVLARKRR